jgi:hypothetical protein
VGAVAVEGAVVAGAAVVEVDGVAAVVGDSVAARQVADFPAAGGRLPARGVAAVALRVAAASTVGRHSVLPAGRAPAEGRAAARWQEEADHHFNQGRDLLSAAAREAPDPVPVWDSDRKLVPEARDLESDSCRQRDWEEGRDLGLDSPTESGPVSGPASARGSAPA